jgi:hypothetical protein
MRHLHRTVSGLLGRSLRRLHSLLGRPLVDLGNLGCDLSGLHEVLLSRRLSPLRGLSKQLKEMSEHNLISFHVLKH